MGKQHIHDVLSIPFGMVAPAEHHILMILAEQTNDKRPGWAHDLNRIAHMGHMSRATLFRRLRSLESAGFISRMPQRRTDLGEWKPVTVILTIHAGIAGQGTTPFRRRSSTNDRDRLEHWKKGPDL